MNNNDRRIQAKDLRVKNRTALQEVIPLKAPFLVYIDPTNRCNFRCEFCPTSDKKLLRQVGRPSSIMPLALFKKAIDDLREFETPLKLLSLYKDGEPLLHPDFPKMVRYARESNIAERIWTKTNGAALTPKLNRQLIEAGLDMICISVESTSSAGYKRIAKATIDYEKFLANIADLYKNRGNCQIYIKIADTGLDKSEIEKFYSDFEEISTHIAIEKLMGWSYSDIKDFTLGTNPDTYDGLPLIQKKICAYPFYVMAVNADGSVSTCGNDWSHGTVVGNINKSSLSEIWNGESLYELRKLHLQGNRNKIRACAECYYIKITPDNIDQYADLIENNLKTNRKEQPQVIAKQNINLAIK